MNILDRIKTMWPVDPESVAAYQTVLPRRIHVKIKQDNGMYIAHIDKLGDDMVKGLLITEASDIETLVSHVNDLVYTKFNMPLNVRPYYGNVFKPKDRTSNSEEMVLVKA